MSANNAKPRARTAASSRPRRRASTSSAPNRPPIRRRTPAEKKTSVADRNQEAPLEQILRLSRKHRRGKPISMGQALRTQGFDEHVAASQYIAFAEKPSQDATRVGPAQKMRLDVLKECTRHLENAQKAERSAEEAAAADAPVYVQLVHAVPRPDRATAEARNSNDESRDGTPDVNAASDSSPR